MSPKARRPEHRGLPARWRFKNGAYRYLVPKGCEAQWDGKTEFKLGTTLPEAHRVWATRMEHAGDVDTMADLLDDYTRLVLPTKAPRTQQTESPVIANLRKAFGGMRVSDVVPRHAYGLKKTLKPRGESVANRHIAVLSHALSMAVEWGVIDNNPIIKNVKKFGYKPRTRYVEDWELAEALRVAPDLIVAYVPVKLMLGFRKGDILGIRRTDIRDDGIRIVQSKTRKPIVIEWDDAGALRLAIDNVRLLRRKVGSLYLFHTRRGEPYVKADRTTSGFDSIWQRWMRRALDETGLKVRFTEHDLRAKTGSDADEQHATQLLDHASDALTRRVYRRREKRVKPHSIGQM